MIPIRLTIEGLYSYQARQTIEFGPLLDAELFGIFGATGSGKSSILDAIFYALYNKTERLEGTVAGGTAYNMMNLKANRLWIDFEFALSQNANHKYRYTVEYKRNSKQYQKIGQAKRGYFSWEHGNWMPKDALSAESLIGLNYDNFKRTIIIPQGKFQDFISLRDKDRANMLEDIFGLNKYELSGHVKILKTQNEQALAHLQGQLQAYQLVSEALIEENQDEIKALNLQLEESQQALNQIQVQYDQLNQLHDLITRQQALTEEWQALENQQPQINQRREQLQQYLIVIRDFETQLADHKRLTEEMNRTNQALSIMKADYDEEQLGVQRESNLFEEKIKPAFDQRETLKQQADEYLFLLKLQEKQETLTAIQQRWEKGKGVMAKSKQQSATFSHQITQLEEEVEQMKGQLPDLEVLRAIEQWITHKKRWQEKLAEQQQQIDEIQLEIEAARNQKRTLLASTDLDPRQHELPVQQILSLLNDRLATHQSQLGEYQKQLHQLAVQHQLASLAHELKPGEACPLCGATDHPKVENHTPSPHQKERLEKQLAEKTQTIEQFRNLLPRLESLQSEAQKIAKKRKQFNDLIQQSERELTLHESRFIWSEFDPSKENAIELQLQKHKGIQSDIEALELRVRSLRQSQKDETQNQQQYQTALDQLNQEFAKLEGEIQAGRQNLQHFSLEKEGTLRGDQLHDLAEKLLNDYKGITDSYERLNRNLQTRKNRLSELLGKIEGEEQHFHHKSKEIA